MNTYNELNLYSNNRKDFSYLKTIIICKFHSILFNLGKYNVFIQS